MKKFIFIAIISLTTGIVSSCKKQTVKPVSETISSNSFGLKRDLSSAD